ncbi:hypothetical protein [Rhodopila sp.]|uniref:hypothetical protein n=1 Tax=Rhodopila sp. TaxID=2480087 RepID=UPI003D0D5AA7
MSVILTGSGGKVVMAAPGRPMLAGPLPAVASGSSSALVFSSAGGLTGWWDAGVAAGVLDSTGLPLTRFGVSAGSAADKSGSATPLTVWHAATSGTGYPTATPRLNGLLGGIGLNMIVPPTLPASGQQLPLMDPDQGLVSGAMSLGAGAAWTVFLVWSRPNWRQSSTAASTLLSIGGIQVLAVDNNSGGRLVLFPGPRQTVLATTITRRHSHAVILRNTPGTGVDVWLDATQVATAAPNPLAPSAAAPLLFLHDGTAGGGAECWFHEAAVWNNALTIGGIAAVLTYETRWILGPRKGIQVLVTGQSNAGNGWTDGAWHLLAQGVAWHLGALGFGVVANYGDTSSRAATCIHGEGIYPVTSGGLPLTGSFLNNPGDGSTPSTWHLGADGLAVQTWIQSDTAAEDAADIAVILWPWSEDDSTRLYSEKATYEAAARQFLSLERGMLSRSPASLPQVWWSAIPFPWNNNDPGTQMQREVVADMAADPTQNVTVVLPQTSDSLPRCIGGAPLVYDPVKGIWSGGDNSHRDLPDNQRFGMLAAPLVARAILASEGGDTITAIPAGIPAAGGPMVIHVYRQSNTSLIITVHHDSGTDLIVPATLAAVGAGWAVMDGGSVASPGTIVTATACVRLNTTQVQITLSQALVNPSASCRLFYPYGTATMGRGNSVTDNFSEVTPPLGWNIAADLGTAPGVEAAFVASAAALGSTTPLDYITTPWRFNIPVHIPMATASGVQLSDTP